MCIQFAPLLAKGPYANGMRMPKSKIFLQKCGNFPEITGHILIFIFLLVLLIDILQQVLNS